MKLKEALTREADEACERQRQKEDLENEEAYAAAHAARQLSMAPKAEAPFSIGSPKLRGRGSRITLIEPVLIEKLHNRMTAIGLGDKQRKENLVKTVQHVAARGPQRIVHRRRDWQPALNALRSAHVNFAQVLDLIERELTLAGTRMPVVLPPILLNGAPGCGKTFFAQHLAAFFGTGFERVSMETSQTAAELTGTAAHWSSAQTGRLFNRLIESDHANPVFLLDEVDKAGGHESYRSDKALYALLERESARQWADASLPDLVLDASHVIWLLTSNDARLIPAPLRSRMRQFDIQPLGPHEARQLVRFLYRQEVERYPHLGLNPELAIAHCEVLRVHSPRVVARLAHELVARLAKEGRREVELSDLEAIGALGALLVEFDRHFDGLIEWKVQ